ncbi:hypothetical protein PSHT_09049 [Puccinia striiformis]|uniref:RING-type domain-containing protein n=1 Tax=Puccinia striiformis TaxID=27350 RepID=A0A2S4VJQ6_9BASI|nr:hypothetical protein PSHT_09049 [Puccinia striiformis]
MSLVGQSIGGPPRTPIPALESAGQSNRVELFGEFRRRHIRSRASDAATDFSRIEKISASNYWARLKSSDMMTDGFLNYLVCEPVSRSSSKCFKTDRSRIQWTQASSTPTHSHSDEDIPSTSLVDGNSLTLGTVEASDTETGNMCAICLDELKSELRTLRCKHTFHKDCIEKWFTAQDDHRSIIKTCPNCRTKVKLTFHQVLRPYWELMTGLPGVCKIIWTHRNELRLLFLVTNFF